MRSPCTATKSRPCSPQLEKARAQQQRPNTAIKKKKKVGETYYTLPLRLYINEQSCKQCMKVLTLH